MITISLSMLIRSWLRKTLPCSQKSHHNHQNQAQVWNDDIGEKQAKLTSRYQPFRPDNADIFNDLSAQKDEGYDYRYDIQDRSGHQGP